ncbi:MAG: ABC transporter ATP-binding protein [Actinomycetota bacterium]|nr:ABC transporter ATP-binding protein [Actinomycetota bacterium]
MEAAALTATGIRKSYRGRMVLDVDRLGLAPGRTLALLGPSGSGKSTLLSILGLLERADEGTVELDGRVVTHRDRDARMAMAAAFQRPYLFKGTVRENVAYGLKLRGMSGAAASKRVAAALDRVGLGGWEANSALTLSGGEAQRVALARALVLEPRVLLLDEPLASLDPLLKWRLTREFARILGETGTTAFYVTHDQDEAQVIADDVAVMNAGRIIAHGRVEDVFGLPADEWTAAFLGMEPALSGVVAESEDGVARVDCNGIDVYAVSGVAVGEEVLVAVRPEDVTLFEARALLPPSSARNRIEGVVVELTHSGATYRVVVEAGRVRMAARVSRQAVADLSLETGVGVTAVFKATAVRVAARGVPGGV